MDENELEDGMDEVVSIFEEIKEEFPEMDNQEIEVEFLTLAWIESAYNRRRVIETEEGLLFADNSYVEDLPPGRELTTDEYFSRHLAKRLVESIEMNTVYVINNDDGLVFMNKHEMSMDDFFLRAVPTKKALEFVQEIVDSTLDDTELV